MRTFLALFIAFSLTGALGAQESEPPGAGARAQAADLRDVESLKAIISALYDVISGPPGARDWARFGSLFREGARLIPTRVTPEGEKTTLVWSPEQYAERTGPWFANNAFYEREASRLIEQYGHIAHVFSTYESRRAPEAEPFTRGINSIQLMHDGSRWWIVSVLWADEQSSGPIPERYLPRQ